MHVCSGPRRLLGGSGRGGHLRRLKANAASRASAASERCRAKRQHAGSEQPRRREQQCGADIAHGGTNSGQRGGPGQVRKPPGVRMRRRGADEHHADAGEGRSAKEERRAITRRLVEMRQFREHHGHPVCFLSPEFRGLRDSPTCRLPRAIVSRRCATPSRAAPKPVRQRGSGISGERRAAGVEKDVVARSRLKRGWDWQGDGHAGVRTSERRSGRQQQRARQADARAHSAKIADSALRLVRQRRCGCCRMSVARTRRGHNVGLRAGPIEVDMAERKRELASQREQRQPRRDPPCSEPMHPRDFPNGGSVANLATQFKPRESRERRRNGTAKKDFKPV